MELNLLEITIRNPATGYFEASETKDKITAEMAKSLD
jgi:hypothetical protein